MASRRIIHGIPNIIVIGVPNQESLEKTRQKLVSNGISHIRWDEPDGDLGFTALCTVPLNMEQKEVLKNYRLWKPLAGSSIGRAAADGNIGGKMDVRPVPSEPDCASSLAAQS